MKNKFFIIILLFLLANNICMAVDITSQQTSTIKASSKKVFSFRKFYLGLDDVTTNGYYTLDAKFYIEKGNFDKASVAISKALYFYDKNPLTYVLKAEIEFHNNNIIEAKKDYDKAEQINDTVSYDNRLYGTYTNNTLWERICKGRAKIALKENNIPEANKIIDYITTHWFYLDEEVFKIKSEILKAEDKNVLSQQYKNIYDILTWTKELDDKNPNHAYSFYQRALALHQAQEDKFALYYINKAIKLKQDSDYYLLKYELIENDSEKVDLLNTAINLNPKNANAYLERANYFYYHQERYESVLNDYIKAIELGKLDEKDFIEEIGTCYFRLGNYPKAYEYYSKSVDCLGLKADTLLEMGKYKEALAIYNSILNNQKYDKGTILYNIACCKENLGDKQSAIQNYTKAINLGNPEFYYDRGLLYYNLKNYRLALNDFNLFISKIGNDGEVIFYRGKCYMALGNYKKALQDFYNGIYSADALYSEAYCRYKIGDRLGAIKVLLKIQSNGEFMLEDMETYKKAVKLLNSI